MARNGSGDLPDSTSNVSEFPVNSQSKSRQEPSTKPWKGGGVPSTTSTSAPSGPSSYATIGRLREKYMATSKTGTTSVPKGSVSVKSTPTPPAAEPDGRKTLPERDLPPAPKELAVQQGVNEATLRRQQREQLGQIESLRKKIRELEVAVRNAEADREVAIAASDMAVREADSLRQVMEEQFLTPDEVEEAAMKCCWLAHYWGLARNLGILPQYAGAKASYWSSVAPLQSTLLAAAKSMHNQLQAQAAASLAKQQQAMAGNGEGGQSSAAPTSTTADSLDTFASTATTSVQPTAADVVELERALREMSELQVQLAVHQGLAQQVHLQRVALLQPPTTAKDWSPQNAFRDLSQEQASECRFLAAWLTFMWSRAAVLGIEPQVATMHADFWRSQIDAEPSLQQMAALHKALQDLRLLGVEQQLWHQRHRRQLKQKPTAEPVAAAGATADAPAAK